MDTLLKLQNVSVQFSGLSALANVSFDAHAGEVRAIIGPNGAGKTTLFNAISGYVPTSHGARQTRVISSSRLSGAVRWSGSQVPCLRP